MGVSIECLVCLMLTLNSCFQIALGRLRILHNSLKINEMLFTPVLSSYGSLAKYVCCFPRLGTVTELLCLCPFLLPTHLPFLPSCPPALTFFLLLFICSYIFLLVSIWIRSCTPHGIKIILAITVSYYVLRSIALDLYHSF